MSDYQEDPHYWQKRAFDRQDERKENQLAAAIESGHNAIKASLLLNGAACIALLGFLANTLGLAKDGGDAARLLALMLDSLSYFAAGAMLAAVTAGLGYLTNFCAATSAGAFSKHFNTPFIRATKSSSNWGRAYSTLTVITIVVAIASYIAFAMGVAKIRGWM